MRLAVKSFAIVSCMLIGGVSVVEARSEPIYEPSFSCSGKLNQTERTICKSSTLIHMDVEMAMEYRNLRSMIGSRKRRDMLRKDQLDWIVHRDECRRDTKCLGQRYDHRIGQLAKWISDLKKIRNNKNKKTSYNKPKPAKYPTRGYSYGGRIRMGPGVEFEIAGRTYQGQKIKLLARTRSSMNGYHWFKIKDRRGLVGYQWGGLLCNLRNPSEAFECPRK